MSKFKTEDGVNIFFQTFGSGPLHLLFMHGWAGSGSFFNETLRYLNASKVCAITFDLRGHGESDKVTHGYTLDRFAQDAFGVADQVGAKKFVVVGYSMSGKFGQYLSCLHPERVAGQILVAGAAASKILLPPDVQRDWVSRAGDREKLLELERTFITQPVSPVVLDRWVADAVKIPAFVLNATLDMCTQTSFMERLKNVQTPTLVVGGLHDQLVTPDVLRQEVVAPLSGAQLELLDCNHDVPIERAQQLAGLIEEFVEELPW